LQKATIVCKIGLDTFLLKWASIEKSLKQKINDLRNKEFKGEYKSKRSTSSGRDENKSAGADTGSRSGMTSGAPRSKKAKQSAALDYEDLIQSSQRSLADLFIDKEADDAGDQVDSDDDALDKALANSMDKEEEEELIKFAEQFIDDGPQHDEYDDDDDE
jgi:hypothetical protein